MTARILTSEPAGPSGRESVRIVNGVTGRYNRPPGHVTESDENHPAFGKWRVRAACLVTPTKVFYSANIRKALEICESCPVVTECREFGDAVELGESFVWGVLGGETAKQRVRRRGKGSVKLWTKTDLRPRCL